MADQNEDVVSTAIRWFVRLRAEDITELEHDQFFDWIFESQTNQQAFAEVLSLWDSLAVIKILQCGDDEETALNLLQKTTTRTSLSNTELSQLF